VLPFSYFFTKVTAHNSRSLKKAPREFSFKLETEDRLCMNRGYGSTSERVQAAYVCLDIDGRPRERKFINATNDGHDTLFCAFFGVASSFFFQLLNVI
jgi:hypothetical protein